MLDFAPPRKLARAASVCILSPNGRAVRCRCRNRFGYVLPRITTRKPSKSNKSFCPTPALFGDKAFAEKQITALLKEQLTKATTPKKKPKGGQLTEFEKYHNRLIGKFRQPIESLFNWIIEKTNIQKASKVRSTDGLMIHCWGKLAFAFLLLVFYY